MQKKNKKLVSFCSLATLVISSSVVSTTGVKAADTDTQRIGGADRYETASLISQEGWKNGSDYVVIANGQTGVDALTASPLAKAKDAPILLTEGNTLNPTALAEIKRLGAKHIIFVGGTGVIPESVASQIKSEIPSSDVARYDGKDRFETAVKIAGALGTPSKVFVANGLTFADALSAAPIAAITGSPIILSQDKQLPKVSSDYIKSNSSITKTYVVGGSGVVSDSILNSLPGSQRLGGADRYATNAAIVSAFASELDFSGIYVARGDVFADSLTGSVLAAKNKSALVITATSGVLSSATEKLFTDLANKGTKIISLGGSAVLPDSVISKIKDAINNSKPAPPTPGGGGTVSNPIEDKLNNSTLGTYFTAQVTSIDNIILTTKADYKNKLATTSEIFNVIADDDYTADQIKAKLDTAYAIAGNHIDTVTTGSDKTFEQVLSELSADPEFASSKYAKYITGNTIDTSALANDIKAKIINNKDYVTFVSKLADAITNSITDKDTSPTIKYSGSGYSLDIYKIVKSDTTLGDTTLYDSSRSRSTNIKSILGIDESGNALKYTTTGTYKLYYGTSGSYITVTVK